MSKTPTCEERIEEHLKDRLERIAQDIAWYKAWSMSDRSYALDRAASAQERLQELPLAVASYKVIKVELSTGGPADWIEYNIDEDNDIISVDYHFADWFDHAERELRYEDEKIAISFFEMLGLGEF